MTPSPEPFSNFALSAGEDTLAIFLTWFATQHPIAAALIVAGFLAVIVALMRWVIRAMKNLFHGSENEAGNRAEHDAENDLAPSNSLLAESIDPMPILSDRRH